MATDFLQAQKKQRYLMLILTLAICTILLVVWLGFFKKAPAPAVAPVSAPLTMPKVEIHWDVLKDVKLEALKNFEQIPAFANKTGRKNPFTPY